MQCTFKNTAELVKPLFCQPFARKSEVFAYKLVCIKQPRALGVGQKDFKLGTPSSNSLPYPGKGQIPPPPPPPSGKAFRVKFPTSLARKIVKCLAGFYLGFIVLGAKSRVAEGHELPRGVQGYAPQKFWEMNVH